MFLAYRSARGHALIDRQLYLPTAWTEDRDRCRASGIPDEVGFATKIEMARQMLDRSFTAGVPAAWVTMDEVYGQAKSLRVWLEDHDQPYVVATRCNDDVVTTSVGRARVDDLVAGLPGRAWSRISAGAGAHGPHEYWWARVPIRVFWRPGRGHWLLARRNMSTGELAYYVCHGPAEEPADGSGPYLQDPVDGRAMLPAGKGRRSAVPSRAGDYLAAAGRVDSGLAHQETGTLSTAGPGRADAGAQVGYRRAPWRS